MPNDDILNEVNTLLRTILDDDSIRVTMSSTASDVSKWDSLSHINLLVALEVHYKIKFNTAEIETLRDVGELVHAISVKCSRANFA
jgi:acyl carrier protein